AGGNPAMSFASKRVVTSTAVAAGVVLATVGAGVGTVHAATAKHQPASKVIVQLRHQHRHLSFTKGNASRRVEANRRSEASVVSMAASMGAKNLHSFGLIN